MICPTCNGYGEVLDRHSGYEKRCPECYGNGALHVKTERFVGKAEAEDPIAWALETQRLADKIFG